MKKQFFIGLLSGVALAAGVSMILCKKENNIVTDDKVSDALLKDLKGDTIARTEMYNYYVRYEQERNALLTLLHDSMAITTFDNFLQPAHFKISNQDMLELVANPGSTGISEYYAIIGLNDNKEPKLTLTRVENGGSCTNMQIPAINVTSYNPQHVRQQFPPVFEQAGGGSAQPIPFDCLRQILRLE